MAVKMNPDMNFAKDRVAHIIIVSLHYTNITERQLNREIAKKTKGISIKTRQNPQRAHFSHQIPQRSTSSILFAKKCYAIKYEWREGQWPFCRAIKKIVRAIPMIQNPHIMLSKWTKPTQIIQNNLHCELVHSMSKQHLRNKSPADGATQLMKNYQQFTFCYHQNEVWHICITVVSFISTEIYGTEKFKNYPVQHH